MKELRKTKLLENEGKLQAATPEALTKIKELEGQEMCEIVQKRINKYLNDTREPEEAVRPVELRKLPVCCRQF
jgi:hypothetical protein